MIAIQSLKYFIWDYCLTKLFDGFEKNFAIYSENSIDIEDIRVGMIFSRISRINSVLSDKSWYICKILKIEIVPPEENIFPNKYDHTIKYDERIVTFSYSKINCSKSEAELEDMIIVKSNSYNIRNIIITNYPDFSKFVFIK